MFEVLCQGPSALTAEGETHGNEIYISIVTFLHAYDGTCIITSICFNNVVFRANISLKKKYISDRKSP